MEKLNHLLEITKHQHHIPTLLLFLIGLIIVKKKDIANMEDGDFLGENIPTTLIDSLWTDRR